MRALALCIAGVLLVLGVWPFAVYLDAVPLQPDSIKWIEKAVPGSEGWSQWTFHSSHFVGYRPLTALSFTADLGVFGTSASALRWTDVGLHLLSALVVFFLARKLARAGGASRGAVVLAGSMALAWFLLHVGTDEVVPFLSRRSYPLAVVLACSGLAMAAHVAERAKDALRSAGAFFQACLIGPLLLASMFGNELGALLAVALPFVVFSAARANPFGRTAALTAWGWAWIALGVWVRRGVLAEGSGYEVAAAEPGRAMEIVKLFGAALGGELGEASRLWGAAATLVLVYYLVTSLLMARDRTRSAPLGLMLVLAVYGAVIANEGVWFPRQVYPATALVALIFGLVAAWTLRGANKQLKASRLAHAVPQALALGMMVMHSPALVGTSPFRAERARVATSFTQSLSAELDALEGAVEVQAVVPIPEPKNESGDDLGDESNGERNGEQRKSLRASSARPTARLSALRVPLRWLRLVYPDPSWTLRDILYVVDPDQSHPPEVDATSSTLSLPPNVRCFGVPHRQIRELPRTQDSFRLPEPRDAKRPVHLWVYGATE